MRGIVTPNVVIGMSLFVGGLAQLLAGMWEFAAGNTFSATGECPFPVSFSSLSPRSLLAHPYLPIPCQRVVYRTTRFFFAGGLVRACEAQRTFPFGNVRRKPASRSSTLSVSSSVICRATPCQRG